MQRKLSSNTILLEKENSILDVFTFFLNLYPKFRSNPRFQVQLLIDIFRNMKLE